MTRRRLPQTDSIEELARFWDTHDLTEFEDELEEVQEPVFERAPVLHVRLEPDEYAAVRRMAEARGLAYSELIHEWVAEKVQGQHRPT